MIGNKTYQQAIKSLWNGKCTVSVRVNRTDENTGRTVSDEVDIYTDAPCRISFSSVKSTESANSAALVAQSVTLYTDSAVEIPEGSKITVTQNGTTAVYTQSGKAAVYSNHKEIPLELFKGWA